MSASKHQPEKSRPPASEERVIEIGWQVIVLPLVAIAVLVGGFYLGRELGDRGSAVETGQPAASVAEGAPAVAVPDSQVYQVPAAGDGSVIEIQPPSLNDPSARFDQDTVYDLPKHSHPLLGKPAPDFTMTLLSTGEQVSLSDYAGQPVIIDFWATWCPPCRYEMPWFESVYNKYREQGLVVLGFNVGEKVAPSMAEAQIQQFVNENNLTFPILVGEQNLQVQREWTVPGYPSAFFVDAEGVIADYHRGMFPNQITLESRLATSILPEAAEALPEG